MGLANYISKVLDDAAKLVADGVGNLDIFDKCRLSGGPQRVTKTAGGVDVCGRCGFATELHKEGWRPTHYEVVFYTADTKISEAHLLLQTPPPLPKPGSGRKRIG